MYKDKFVSAIIVAAGKGTRMGSEIPKQYLSVGGKTILETTLYKFEKSNEVDEIILIVNKEDLEYVRNEMADFYKKITCVRAGGSTRTESVYEGIKSVSRHDGIVLIHDGVRPFISYNLITSCVEGAYNYKACIPVVDVVDTVKETGNDGFVNKTLDRSHIKAVQTPQAFEYELISECYHNAVTEDAVFTDDSSIAEYYGYKVRVIDGLTRNIKITTPQDLRIAEIFASLY